MEKLFLIDAYALIFKFYYALIGRPMRNSKGLNTSAIYGFTRFINDIISNEKPHHIAVAFDPSGGNFRHILYPEYKANRSATPEDIKLSIPYIKEILQGMDIPILEVAGYEADDVIGTIAKKASADGYVVYMVTPDKDYGQLIEENIYMYKPSNSGSGVEVVGYKEVCAKYNIDSPSKVIDLLALWGDKSDNVPGVPGVGEKTAIKLINEYGSIDNILDNCDKLKGKQRDNFLCNKDQLILSRELVTIKLDVPIDFDINAMAITKPDVDRLCRIYTELNFTTFQNDLVKSCSTSNASPQREVFSKRVSVSESPQEVINIVPNNEPSLFDDFQPIINSSPSLFDLAPVEVSRDIDSYEHLYTLINIENVDKIVDIFSMSDEFCFDTETTGLDTLQDRLIGISMCKEKGVAYYIPIDDTDAGLLMLKKLKPLFENEKIAKIGQNIKFDMSMLRGVGIEVKGTLYDTMIIHYLLNSEDRHNMDYLSEKYLGYNPISITSLIGKGAKQLSMDSIDVNVICEYACEDADVTYQLKKILWDELKRENLVDLYLKIEEPLIEVLCDMEYNGVKIDRYELKQFSEELSAELSILEEKICEMSGVSDLNVNSPKQLGVVLFEKLNIVDKPKRTKTKQYKTDEEYLVSLIDKHEIVGLILEYRGVKKLLSTYIDALPELINPKTGRIHTSYNQAVTSTGRLSSSNPNLQNIPIRTENGKKIREAFIASDEDHLLISADYSQVELRIMAHLSKDPAMVDAFLSGEDIHTSTASKIYGTPISEVTSEERRRAKTANFGIIYGISVFGLSQRLSISRSDAKALIDGYFASYPQVAMFMEDSISRAREAGYSETIHNRKRFIADINSRNSVAAGFAERNAINAPIQGSAADIIKLAMITLYKKLKSSSYDAKIILQVHDELIVEVSREDEEEVRRLIIKTMEEVAELSVPLIVDANSANNWLDAH